MPFEHRDNSALLFLNTNKTKDNQPDYTGKGKLDGLPIELAGWKKTTNDKDMISMNIKKIEDNNDAPF